MRPAIILLQLVIVQCTEYAVYDHADKGIRSELGLHPSSPAEEWTQIGNVLRSR